jgi:hypothetical protein
MPGTQKPKDTSTPLELVKMTSLMVGSLRMQSTPCPISSTEMDRALDFISARSMEKTEQSFLRSTTLGRVIQIVQLQFKTKVIAHPTML